MLSYDKITILLICAIVLRPITGEMSSITKCTADPKQTSAGCPAASNNNRPKILMTNPSIPEMAFEMLGQKCELIRTLDAGREEILDKVSGVDAIFWATKVQLDEEILERAGPQMKVVGTMSAGVNHINVNELKKRGIKLGNTPNVLNDAVADVAVLLALAAGRRLHEGRLMIDAGKWEFGLQWLMGQDLARSTVGVVGLGGIGQAIIKRLKGFNVNQFLYNTRTPKPEAAELGAEYASLTQLVEKSDYVILALPLTSQTRNMFNQTLFERMKKTAVFINISRGEIVNQDDLFKALKDGTIFAAGLDVMVPEPINPDHELLTLPNCESEKKLQMILKELHLHILQCKKNDTTKKNIQREVRLRKRRECLKQRDPRSIIEEFGTPSAEQRTRFKAGNVDFSIRQYKEKNEENDAIRKYYPSEDTTTSVVIHLDYEKYSLNVNDSFENIPKNNEIFINNNESQNKRTIEENEKENTTIIEDDECEDDDPDYTPHTSIDSSLQKSNSSNPSIMEFQRPPVDARELKVPCSQNNGKRLTKKDFCLFCKKLTTKLARHLENMHFNEGKVKEFIYLPKGVLKRRRIIDKIRREGNFLHNTNSEYNTGILITCHQQQPKFNKKAEDYVVCSTCLGSFSKRTLRIHYKNCNVNHKKGNRDINIKGRRLECFVHDRSCELLRKSIIPVMNDDEITRLIKYDELIILIGNKFCEKYTYTHQHDLIRSNLRLLGRFKNAIMKKRKELKQLSSIYHPQYYDDAVEAVRYCAGFDSNTQLFRSPSVATSLGTLLKKCGRQWIAECIKKQDEKRKKDAEEFLILYDNDFSTTVNKKVIEDQIRRRRAKKINLPLKKDIQILYNYLKRRCDDAMTILENSFDYSAWKSLAESSLIVLQMFNRRRAGEIERILIEDFNNRESVDQNGNPDFYSKLSEKSREYARRYVRITIRGKLGRTVPALLDNSLVNYLKSIISNRNKAGVRKSNPFVFGIPTSNSYSKNYLRACDLMRKFAEDCGATLPETLRGTNLRKHVATYTAMLGLEENQVSDLANFMGHNKQIHKDIYRVPIPMKDVTDISQLLQAAIGMEEGNENHTINDNIISEPNISDYSVNSSITTLDNDEESIIPKKRRSSSPYGKTKRRKWTTEESNAVQDLFGDPKTVIKLPSLKKCQEAIKKCPALKHRQPQQIKTWIDNQRKAISRKRVS